MSSKKKAEVWEPTKALLAVAAKVKAEEKQVVTLNRQALPHAKRMGQLLSPFRDELMEAKKWPAYCKQFLGMTPQNASGYVRIFDGWDKVVKTGAKTVREALKAVAVKGKPQAGFKLTLSDLDALLRATNKEVKALSRLLPAASEDVVLLLAVLGQLGLPLPKIQNLSDTWKHKRVRITQETIADWHRRAGGRGVPVVPANVPADHPVILPPAPTPELTAEDLSEEDLGVAA